MRRIVATTRTPSAACWACAEKSAAARESRPSVRALPAEELVHLVVELLH
jgi:hypothetical protein